jgi:hypothetical protein
MAGNGGAHLPSATQASTNRRIMVQAGLSTKRNNTKRTWGVAEMVEHLSSKCEALNLIPSVDKK